MVQNARIVAWNKSMLYINWFYLRKLLVMPFRWFRSWYIYAAYLGHTSRSYVLWASYQIRKIAGCACAGNAGNVFPRRRFQRKPVVSDPGMHHGTCVTHVPWCMSGSLTRGRGENVPGIPGACASALLRIWQEAHGRSTGLEAGEALTRHCI